MKIKDLKVGMLLNGNSNDFGCWNEGMRVEIAAWDYAVVRVNDNPILITNADHIELWKGIELEHE